MHHLFLQSQCLELVRLFFNENQRIGVRMCVIIRLYVHTLHNSLCALSCIFPLVGLFVATYLVLGAIKSTCPH